MSASAHDDGAALAGQRALINTGARAGGELIAKVCSVILLVVLTRSVDATDVGVYVFAFAFSTLITVPVSLGFDPYLIREVARDRQALDYLFFNILALKLVMAVPVATAGFAALSFLGYDDKARLVTYVVMAGVVVEILVKTLDAGFIAHERSALAVVGLVSGRLTAAVLGVIALRTGHGVLIVAFGYVIGVALYLVVALALFGFRIGTPRRRLTPHRWRALVSRSMPFAMQDVATAILFRLDAVLLSLLASAAAVGRYGACYRLMESTMFISAALLSAFSAMYVYLGPQTRPTVATVFQGSLKLALALLLPIAVVAELRADTVVRLFFGHGFADAAPVLRLLAPVIVLLGLWALSVTLVLSRTRPGAVLRLSIAMVALNAIGNLVLIPPFSDVGAAAAMLLTEVIFASLVVRRAVRAVGGIHWFRTVAGPAGAACAMAIPLIGIEAAAISIPVAILLYVAALTGIERVVAPSDARFVIAMLGRRLPVPKSR